MLNMANQLAAIQVQLSKPVEISSASLHTDQYLKALKLARAVDKQHLPAADFKQLLKLLADDKFAAAYLLYEDDDEFRRELLAAHLS